MKKLYFALVLINGFAFGQVQLKTLTEFGTAIYGINENGKGVHGNGYYDFETNSSSSVEEGVGQTVTITNNGDVLGMMDDGTGVYVPALKKDGTWTVLPGIPADVTLYDISENGKYIVGQTSWTTENGAWGFIYNTDSFTYTIISSNLYEGGAIYGVNNSGIAVGWVDDLESGTLRMPAYFTEDNMINLITSENGEAKGINSNGEIVGTLNGLPMYYKIGDATPKTYDIPTELSGLGLGFFSGISDNSIIVGYFQTYIPLQGFVRYPAIYHSSLGENPLYLKDFLSSNGIDAEDLDGTAYCISAEGKYIGGFSSGTAFFAQGWAVYLDDLFTLGTQESAFSKISVYPNPAKETLNINAKNITAVEVYNLVGQKVQSAKAASQINVSNLAKGVYLVKVTAEGKTQTVKFIKD